jgi:serine/threonine protein phosphatase PrpC
VQDEPEVHRVWLPYDDAPGLAMARAFGDFCLKEYGVIAIPEVSYRLLTERDQFVVLASDGVSHLNGTVHIYTFSCMFTHFLACLDIFLLC